MSGQAKSALEGYFLLGTESAYAAAWKILDERYGNPFTIAKAYRDKLQAWPKMTSKDSFELRNFADFLCSCEAAMVRIKSLEMIAMRTERFFPSFQTISLLAGTANRGAIKSVSHFQSVCFASIKRSKDCL